MKLIIEDKQHYFLQGSCVNQYNQCENYSWNCYYCNISWGSTFYCGDSDQCAQYWWIWVVGVSGFLLVVAIVIIIIKKRQRAQRDQLLLAANANQQPQVDVIYTPNQNQNNGFNPPPQQQQQFNNYNNNNNYVPPNNNNNNTGVIYGQPTNQIYQ